MWKFLRRLKTGTDHRPSTPTASEASAPAVDVGKLLHRLEWTVLKRLDGLLQGDYRTLLRGNGLELADLREYQPHDDVRHIDWFATARMQTPYVRTYQEERDMTAWMIVDLSGSVRFGSAGRSKLDLALELCGVMARMLTRRGNPVGGMLHLGGRQGIDRTVPAGSGRRHVLRLMHDMANAPTPDASNSTDLASVLRDAAGRLKRRSTVIVVSDFISAQPWQRDLSQLAQRHDVIAVRLRDPIELELPSVGVLPLRDAETGELLWIDAQDPRLRRRFAEQSAQREAELKQRFVQAGVDCLEIDTQEPLDRAFIEFIRMRNPRLRARTAVTSGTPRHV